MATFVQKTLELIAEKKIRPVSVWRVRLKNGAYWFGALLLAVLSALATALSWHALFEIDWAAYGKAHFSWLEILISGVPFISSLLFIVFLWGSIIFLQHTRRGYRYPTSLLIFIFFSSSVLLGYSIETSPLDRPAEDFLLGALPHSEKTSINFFPSAERQWSQPEKGLLGGAVLKSDATEIRLLDTGQKQWTVKYVEAIVEDDVTLEADTRIKIIGRQEGESVFTATEIEVWEDQSSGHTSQKKSAKPEKDSEENSIEDKDDTGEKDD